MNDQAADVFRTEAEEMRRQRDVLAGAIAEAALKAGGYNGEAPLTGPHLLLLLDDMAKEIVRRRDAEMTFERAQEITGQVVRTCLFLSAALGEPTRLPECSLEEMLIANRMMRDHKEPEIKNADGSTTSSIMMTVDPRGIAVAYAFENYGSNPEDLLEAVGFRIRRRDDDEVDDDGGDEG